jgi:hypothetical protein
MGFDACFISIARTMHGSIILPVIGYSIADKLPHKYKYKQKNFRTNRVVRWSCTASTECNTDRFFRGKQVDLHIRCLLFGARRRRVVACIGILLNPEGSPLVGTINNGNVAT